MATQSSLRAAVARAQLVLQSVRPDLKVDGHWGTFTNGAYASAPRAIQMQVEAILAASGYKADAIYAANKIAKQNGDKTYVAERAVARAERGTVATTAAQYSSLQGRKVPASTMRKIVAEVSNASGVSEDTLWKFLILEQGNQSLYDTASRNRGGYSGLFQFDKNGAAWAVASNMIQLPSFASAWQHPYWNTLAAAAYLQANTKTLRRLGYSGPIDGNIAYLMHNQGAGGAFKIIQGKQGLAGNQSKQAMLVAQNAVKTALG